MDIVSFNALIDSKEYDKAENYINDNNFNISEKDELNNIFAEHYRKMGEINKSLEYYGKINKRNEEILYSIAELYFNQNDLNNAVLILNELNNTYEQNGKGFYLLGIIYHKQKKLQEAIYNYNVSIQSEIDEKKLAYYNIAIALKQCFLQFKEEIDFNESELIQIEENYTKAIAIDEKFHKARYGLATCLLQQKKFEDSIEQWKKLTAFKPTDSNIYFNLALSLHQSGRLKEAHDYYLKSIQFNQSFSQAHNNLGELLRESDQVYQSINHYEKAIELDPKQYRFYFNLALALKQTEQYNQACHYFKSALLLNPNSDKLRKHLGDLYFYNLNEPSLAKEQYLAINDPNIEVPEI